MKDMTACGINRKTGHACHTTHKRIINLFYTHYNCFKVKGKDLNEQRVHFEILRRKCLVKLHTVIPQWFRSQKGPVNFELKVIFKGGAGNGFLQIADMSCVSNTVYTVCQCSSGENDSTIL